MVNPLAHWNDILTILTFITTVFIGYYQVQHYRAQKATVKIESIEDISYSGQEKGRYGELMDSTGEDLESTHYSITTVLENSGRNPATISDAEINIADTDEKLPLRNKSTRYGRVSEIMKLEGGDRDKIHFTATGNVRDSYPDTVEGRLRLDTTAGTVIKEVTFEHSRSNHPPDSWEEAT